MGALPSVLRRNDCSNICGAGNVLDLGGQGSHTPHYDRLVYHCLEFFHIGMMAVYALIDKGEVQYLAGDVPYTIGIAVLFLVFIPWKMLKQEQKKGSDKF